MPRNRKRVAHLDKRKLRDLVSKDFQKMIRAEYGALVRLELCVMHGERHRIFSPRGYCVCVTCGSIKPWSAPKTAGIDCMDAGHFLGSRRNSIVFEETNCHCQCSHCNRMQGTAEEYDVYMNKRYGRDEIDRLRRLKNTEVKFDREELMDMRDEYYDRQQIAIEKIHSG